jgi:hypothetical protein
MRRLRIRLATVIVVCLLVGVSQSVFAGPAAHFTVRLNNATIPWVFPPPEGLSSFCSEIPQGVHINPDDFGSDRVKQAIQIDRPDGTTQIVITDLVKGTATDNFGTTYSFVYENTTTYRFDGSTVTVAMKDTFHLKGGDVNYTVGFNWRWSYEADSLTVVEVEDNGETVDLAVAPFLFATDVPNTWEQLSTRGDPLNCDPL